MTAKTRPPHESLLGEFVHRSRMFRQAGFAMFMALVALWSPSASWAQDNRPVVGIAQMADLSDTGEAEAFSVMIETALIGTNKFRVIERSQLAVLLEEQKLALGGLVRSSNPERLGGFEGVDYLIYGTLVALSHEKAGDDRATSERAACSPRRLRLEADIRITDTSTGEVRYVKRLSITEDSPPFCGDGGNTKLLLRSAADRISAGLTTAIYPIQVAAIEASGKIILNYGEGTLMVGDQLMLYGNSMELPDPSGSGRILIDGELLGPVQIDDVQANFSRASPLAKFDKPILLGSIARPSDENSVRQFLRRVKH